MKYEPAKRQMMEEILETLNKIESDIDSFLD